MQNYFMQIDFNTITITIQKAFIVDKQFTFNDLGDDCEISEHILLFRFINFLRRNKSEDFDKLPGFNHLTLWYNVIYLDETENQFQFKLVYNEKLNKNILLQLKHDIYNLYNTLIGFSEVLKETESFDENDYLILNRLNANARDLYTETKILMEFELLKELDFNISKSFVKANDFILSYFNHHTEYGKRIVLIQHENPHEELFLNINHEYFKTSFDLFVNTIFNLFDAVNVVLDVYLKGHIHIEFKFEKGELAENDIIYEISQLNNFFNLETPVKSLQFRLFHFFYIHIVAQKLGGEFNLSYSEENGNYEAIWILPFDSGVNIDNSTLSNVDISLKDSISEEVQEELLPSEELKHEIAKLFSKLESVYILDEWIKFANNLESLGRKKYREDDEYIAAFIKKIRQGVELFDIKALQLIMKNHKDNSISK